VNTPAVDQNTAAGPTPSRRCLVDQNENDDPLGSSLKPNPRHARTADADALKRM